MNVFGPKDAQGRRPWKADEAGNWTINTEYEPPEEEDVRSTTGTRKIGESGYEPGGASRRWLQKQVRKQRETEFYGRPLASWERPTHLSVNNMLHLLLPFRFALEQAGAVMPVLPEEAPTAGLGPIASRVYEAGFALSYAPWHLLGKQGLVMSGAKRKASMPGTAEALGDQALGGGQFVPPKRVGVTAIQHGDVVEYYDPVTGAAEVGTVTDLPLNDTLAATVRNNRTSESWVVRRDSLRRSPESMGTDPVAARVRRMNESSVDPMAAKAVTVAEDVPLGQVDATVKLMTKGQNVTLQHRVVDSGKGTKDILFYPPGKPAKDVRGLVLLWRQYLKSGRDVGAMEQETVTALRRALGLAPYTDDTLANMLVAGQTGGQGLRPASGGVTKVPGVEMPLVGKVPTRTNLNRADIEGRALDLGLRVEVSGPVVKLISINKGKVKHSGNVEETARALDRLEEEFYGAPDPQMELPNINVENQISDAAAGVELLTPFAQTADAALYLNRKKWLKTVSPEIKADYNALQNLEQRAIASGELSLATSPELAARMRGQLIEQYGRDVFLKAAKAASVDPNTTDVGLLMHLDSEIKSARAAVLEAEAIASAPTRHLDASTPPDPSIKRTVVRDGVPQKALTDPVAIGRIEDMTARLAGPHIVTEGIDDVTRAELYRSGQLVDSLEGYVYIPDPSGTRLKAYITHETFLELQIAARQKGASTSPAIRKATHELEGLRRAVREGKVARKKLHPLKKGTSKEAVKTLHRLDKDGSDAADALAEMSLVEVPGTESTRATKLDIHANSLTKLVQHNEQLQAAGKKVALNSAQKTFADHLSRWAAGMEHVAKHKLLQAVVQSRRRKAVIDLAAQRGLRLSRATSGDKAWMVTHIWDSEKPFAVFDNLKQAERYILERTNTPTGAEISRRMSKGEVTVSHEATESGMYLVLKKPDGVEVGRYLETSIDDAERLFNDLTKRVWRPIAGGSTGVEQTAHSVSGRPRAPKPPQKAASFMEGIYNFFDTARGLGLSAVKYLDLRGNTLGLLNRWDLVLDNITLVSRNIPTADRATVWSYVNGRNPVLESVPKRYRTFARNTRRYQKLLIEQMVARGMLPRDIAEEAVFASGTYHYLKAMLRPETFRSLTSRGGPFEALDPDKVLKGDLSGLTAAELEALTSVAHPEASLLGMKYTIQQVASHDLLSQLANTPLVAANFIGAFRGVKVPLARLESIKKATQELKGAYGKLDQGTLGDAELLLAELDVAIKDAKAAGGASVPKEFIRAGGDEWGALNGLHINKVVYDDLKYLLGMSTQDYGKFAKAIFDATAFFKLLKVPLNIPTVIRNLVSNHFQMAMSGIPLHKTTGIWLEGLKDMRAGGQYYRGVLRRGGFKANFNAGELDEIIKHIEDAIKGSSNPWVYPFAVAGRLAKYYGKIDDSFRVGMYKYAIEELGLAPRAAMRHANKWIMDYSFVHPAIRNVRRWAMPFVTYQYKILPLMAESMRNKRTRWIIPAMAALPMVISDLTVRAHPEWDWDEVMRDLPRFMKKQQPLGLSSWMLLPLANENGLPQWVNLSYFFPWGSYVDATMGAISSIKDGDLAGFGSLTKDAGAFNSAIFSLGQVLMSLDQDRVPKDPYTDLPIWNTLDGGANKFKKFMIWQYNQWAPSMATGHGFAGRVGRAAEGRGRTRRSARETPVSAISSLFGVNIQVPTLGEISAARNHRKMEYKRDLNKVLRSDASRGEKVRTLEQYRKKMMELYR